MRSTPANITSNAYWQDGGYPGASERAYAFVTGPDIFQYNAGKSKTIEFHVRCVAQ